MTAIANVTESVTIIMMILRFAAGSRTAVVRDGLSLGELILTELGAISAEICLPGSASEATVKQDVRGTVDMQSEEHRRREHFDRRFKFGRCCKAM